jgi:hypothetical protein
MLKRTSSFFLILTTLFLFSSSSLINPTSASIYYGGTPEPTTSVEVEKRYSYLCLGKPYEDYCLGISPGDTDPVYDPLNLYHLQLKLRSANEVHQTDYKKTRWTVERTTGKMYLTNFTNLCISRDVPGSQEVVLRPCISANQKLWKWNLTSFINPLEAGGIYGMGTQSDYCLAVQKCILIKGQNTLDPLDAHCDPSVTQSLPIGGQIRRGSYVKLQKCSTVVNPIANSFSQRDDCSPGCTYTMQHDTSKPPKYCSLCGNAKCGFQMNLCKTKPPTPPTLQPTSFPSHHPVSSKPSKQPTVKPSKSPVRTPSQTPTTSFPSLKPTKSPTKIPTSQFPTQAPSISPSTSTPSMQPSNHPSRRPSTDPNHPSRSPSLTPTTNATFPIPRNGTAPAAAPGPDLTALWVILGILLGCCLLGLIFFFLKKRKEKQEQEQQQAAAAGGGGGDTTKPIPPTTPQFDVEKQQQKRERETDAPEPTTQPAEKKPAIMIDTTDAGGETGLVQGSSVYLNPTSSSGKYRPVGAEPSLTWGGVGGKSPDQVNQNHRSNSERFTDEVLPGAVANGNNKSSPNSRPPPVPKRNNKQDSTNTDQQTVFVQQIETMSVKELKQFIQSRGGDPSMEVEKSALQQRARDMLFDDL